MHSHHKNAVYGHDLSREKANQQSPQALLVCKYKNNTSAGNGQSEAEAILNPLPSYKAQESKIFLFPALQHGQLQRGVEPVFPALHDGQVCPALLSELFQLGAGGQVILIAVEHLCG